MIDDTNEQQQAPEPAPAANESDFGSAFKERLSQGEDRQQDAEREEPQRPEAQAEGEDSGGPPPPPAQPATAAPAEGTSGPAPKPDPWDGLTPEQRQRVERLQASERSQRGRVGALTKKLNASTSRAPVTIGAAEDQSGQQRGEGGGSEAPATAESLADKIEKARAAAADYPESVGPLLEALEAARSEIEGLKAPVAKAQEDADAAEIAASYQALEEAHGDYVELAQDDSFLGWASEQTEQVKALLNSWNPRDVSLVLTLYKAERQAAQPTTTTTSEAPAAAPKATTETDARRQRQLEGSRDTPSRGTPAAAGVPDDFGAAFRARMRQHAEEAARP